MRAILGCAVVGQVIVVAVLSLKEAAAPAPLLVPLPIATVLLYYYLDQRHFRSAAHLPLAACLAADRANRAVIAASRGGAIARGQYVQPALRDAAAAITSERNEADAGEESKGTPVGSPVQKFESPGAGAEPAGQNTSTMIYVRQDWQVGTAPPPEESPVTPLCAAQEEAWANEAPASPAEVRRPSSAGSSHLITSGCGEEDGGEAVEMLVWPSILRNQVGPV